MKKLFGAILALLLAGPVFGQALSNLPNGTTPTGTEYVPIVQGGNTVKVTTAQILAYIDTQTITWTNPQTYSQLMTLNNGLTVATGNIGITSGNLTVSGTSVFSGLATASLGLNITAGGETISAGGLTVGGTGNVSLSNNGTFFSSALSETTSLGTSSTGVSVGSGSGTTPNVFFISGTASANNHLWDLYADGTSFHGRTVNDAITTAQDWIDVTRSGATVSSVNFPNGTVEVAGNQITTTAYGYYSTNASSCSIVAGIHAYNAGGCTRNSIGFYTVSFSSAFSVTPACVISPNTNSPVFVVELNVTTTGFAVEIWNSSAALIDGIGFEFMCK